MSIHIQKHNSAAELIQYMSIIREAAGRHSGFCWRTYDEQFRLRQANNPAPWSKINPELWLRIMSTSVATDAPSWRSGENLAVSKRRSCNDFNKGQCTFKNCKYSHVCSICYDSQHGRWNCPTGETALQSSQLSIPQFASTVRGKAFRGRFRGRFNRGGRGRPYFRY